MITPRQFDTYPDSLVNIAQAFEEEIITRICQELAIDRRLLGDLVGQGLTQQEIAEWLSSFNDATLEEVERLYSRIYDQVVKDEHYLYDYFGRDSMLWDDVTKQTLIRAQIAQTSNTFNNLARTSGFVFKGVFTPTARVYQAAVDSALQSVYSGRDTRLAVRDTIVQLTNQGLTTVDYDANGRTIHTQIDVAVRRNVVTGMHQISNSVVEIQLQELGVRHVQVSAHQDARNLGVGPMNHESWQGAVYVWNK